MDNKHIVVLLTKFSGRHIPLRKERDPIAPAKLRRFERRDWLEQIEDSLAPEPQSHLERVKRESGIGARVVLVSENGRIRPFYS